VGEGEPCFIIAEAGSNHNGSLELAADIDQCIQGSALRKSMSDSMAQVIESRGVERIVSFIGG